MAEVAGLSHISNPNFIRPGQLLVLGDERICTPSSRPIESVVKKGDLESLQRQVDALAPAEKQVLGRHWDVLQQVDRLSREVSSFSERWEIGDITDLLGGAIDGGGRNAEEAFSRPNHPATRPMVGKGFLLAEKVGVSVRRVRTRAVEKVRGGPVKRTSPFVVRVSPSLLDSRAIVDQMDRMSRIVKASKLLAKGSLYVDVALGACNIVAARPESGSRPR